MAEELSQREPGGPAWPVIGCILGCSLGAWRDVHNAIYFNIRSDAAWWTLLAGALGGFLAGVVIQWLDRSRRAKRPRK